MPTALTKAVEASDKLWQCLAAVGLACCLMATGVFDNAVHTLSNADVYGVRIDTNPLTGGLPLLAGCVLVACACAAGLRERLASLPAGVVLAAAGGSGAGLMFAEFAGVLPAAAGEAGGALLGIASMVSLTAWAEVLAARGRARAMLTLGLAFLLETVVDLLVENALVSGASIALLLLAVLAGPLLACACADARPPARASGASPDASGQPRLDVALPLACVVCWGVLMGRVQSVGNTSEATGLLAFVSSNAATISAFVSALGCLALARMRRADGVTRIAVLALLACSLYFAGVFGTQSIPVGMLTMGMARFTVFAFIWLCSCRLAQAPRADGRVGPAFAVAALWGVFTAANTLSTRLGLTVAVETPAFMAYNVLIMVCLVALIVVEFLPRRSEKTPAPSEAAPTAEDAFAARCDALAERIGLTGREREVLEPLVRGRSAASVAAQLSMSTETARTHIRHIYQKADVHSREELMDLVEGK